MVMVDVPVAAALERAAADFTAVTDALKACCKRLGREAGTRPFWRQVGCAQGGTGCGDGSSGWVAFRGRQQGKHTTATAANSYSARRWALRPAPPATAGQTNSHLLSS